MQAPTFQGNPDRLDVLETEIGELLGEIAIDREIDRREDLRRMLNVPEIGRGIGDLLGSEEAERISGIFGHPAFMQYLRVQNAPQNVIDVFNAPGVRNAIDNGIRGDNLLQVIGNNALALGQNVQDVTAFATPYLLALAPPQVRAGVANIRSAQFAIRQAVNVLPRRSPWRRPAEILMMGLGGLVTLGSLSGGVNLIRQGIERIGAMFDYGLANVDPEDIQTIEDQREQEGVELLINATEKLKEIIMEADDIPNDENNYEFFRSSLAHLPNTNSFTPENKQKLEQQYEINVLSILRRRLMSVINDRLPASYFSTASMKRRSVQPALPINMWSMQGFPSKIV